MPMIKVPNMVLIGATDRNVGKTTLACAIIERLRREYRVIGVKITAADDEKGNVRKGSKGCGSCDDMRGPFEIIEEKNTEGHKDTCLMLKAQAERVYWVKSLRSYLSEAVEALLSRVGLKCVLVCESTGLRTLVQPGLFLLADHAEANRLCRKTPSLARERAIFSSGKDGEAGDVGSIVDAAGCSQAGKGPLEARSGFPGEPQSRPSAERVRQWVDRVICFQSEGFDIDLDRIDYDGRQWHCPAKATCILLAGGRSRRMGEDKSLLPVSGKPMIQHILDQVRPHFDEIIISSNTPEIHQFPGTQTIPDPEQGRGPLMGIAAAMRIASRDTSFVIACDMPNVDIDLMRHMLRQAYQYDAVMPRSHQQYFEPLFAVYNISMLGLIEGQLAQGNNKAQDVVARGNVLAIDLTDAQQASLLNLNTKPDYLRFRETQ